MNEEQLEEMLALAKGLREHRAFLKDMAKKWLLIAEARAVLRRSECPPRDRRSPTA